MIILKKLNGEEFVLNSELIETIMETPDTTIPVSYTHLQVCHGPEGGGAEYRRTAGGQRVYPCLLYTSSRIQQKQNTYRSRTQQKQNTTEVRYGII